MRRTYQITRVGRVWMILLTEADGATRRLALRFRTRAEAQEQVTAWTEPNPYTFETLVMA